MKGRKAPWVDIERYRTHFFLLGLVIALGSAILLLEWQKPVPSTAAPDAHIMERRSDQEVIPITLREPPPVPAEKVLKVPDQIEMVADLEEVEDEFEFGSSETDENQSLSAFDTEYIIQDGPVEWVEQEEEEIEEVFDFVVVEQPPIFPGCERASDPLAGKACFQEQLLRFVQANFEYTEEARQLRISGRIFVEFVIEKDGRVAGVQVLRGLDPLVDKEAVRILRQLPRMEPARQRGKPVRMRFVLPIKTVLHP